MYMHDILSTQNTELLLPLRLCVCVHPNLFPNLLLQQKLIFKLENEHVRKCHYATVVLKCHYVTVVLLSVSE